MRRVEALMKTFVDEEAVLAKIKLPPRNKDKVEDVLKKISDDGLERDFLKIMIERNKEDTSLTELLNFFVQNKMEAEAVKIMRGLHEMKKSELSYPLSVERQDENDGKMEEGHAAVQSSRCCHCTCGDEENDGKRKDEPFFTLENPCILRLFASFR